MPDASKLFTPEVSFKDTVLKADGQASTLVTFTLKDANGNIMKDADKVEVTFTTTLGRFAENRVTVQNGVATVLFTSETLTAAKPATITATVVEAANKNLYGLEAKRNLLLDPNPMAGDDKDNVGARLTEVQAAQADRVIAYFNKDVDYTKYVKAGTYDLDENKAKAVVHSNVANDGNDILPVINVDGATTKNCPVIGVLPVQGNSKALQLVLGTNLIDNANIRVNFNDNTGSVLVPGVADCKLTDARKPAMLSVAREGLKTLKVTFSEPVNANTANSTPNWVIDGVKLSDAVYGDGTKAATAVVGDFNNADGTDTRNVVTITLGTDAKGNQIYFKSGAHSIQGSSIGDWADLTDKGNNVMNTETLDFDIPVDNTAPNATVEVQSPEQYIVTFDKELNETEASIQAAIKLQKYNKDTAKWEAADKQDISVKEITNDQKVKQYKVECKKDWTVAYDTKGTNSNYYNDSYRLFIAKDTITSAANGIKNADIALLLEGAMKTPDVTSPIISKIEANVNSDTKKLDGTYKVTMSEPVKFPSEDATIETRAQGQDSIPTPTAQFIAKDGSKTIAAKVEKGSDVYDKELKVTPLGTDGMPTTLEAGDWTVVVRSISDDIGNTAASATKDFTVAAGEKVKENKFSVVWTFADKDQNAAGKVTDTTADYVYVKFNKPVSMTGDAKNALKTSNYQLDAMPLPTGTQIRANIVGIDDADKLADSITIVLPDGYLNGNNEPHVLTISNYLESTTADDTLTNGGAKKLAWQQDNDSTYNVYTNWETPTEDKLYKLEVAANKDLKNADNLSAAKLALDTATETINKSTPADKDGKTLKYVDLSTEGTELTARYNTAKALVTGADTAMVTLPTKLATNYVTTTFDAKTSTYTATVAAGKGTTKVSDILKDTTVTDVLKDYKLTQADIDANKLAIKTAAGEADFANVTLDELKTATATTPLNLTVSGVTYKIVLK
ncbi:Ig-like domain-containing protein [Clostridium muellerianum]|uniref:Ig-like domain-containing protein n=1 Tax=Clostridium muellerianum TaxID=2716538 RepID=UPI001FAD3D67|nr:Ig-like domain-containing protein [Clostridium muellerianum]